MTCKSMKCLAEEFGGVFAQDLSDEANARPRGEDGRFLSVADIGVPALCYDEPEARPRGYIPIEEVDAVGETLDLRAVELRLVEAIDNPISDVEDFCRRNAALPSSRYPARFVQVWRRPVTQRN